MAKLWDSNFHIARQWYDKAIAQRDRKQYEKALACFDRALALAPKKSEWWYWKGVTLCDDINHYEQALACFDHALEIAPKDANSADYRAFCLFKLDRDEEALVAYDHALTLAPTSGNLWYWKGRTLYSLKRDEEALSCFERSTELAPDKTERWYWKGITLRRLKCDEEAFACFEKSLEIAPNNAYAASESGYALFRLGRYEEALSAYDTALAIALPDDPHELNFWKGWTLRRLNRDEEALACFERAAELAPDSAEAASERAAALSRMGRYDEALTAYDVALVLAPADDPRGLNHWKGETLHRLKRDDEAIAAYDRALEIDPNRADWWVNRSISCFNLKRYDEALADAERAIALDESNGYGWKLKGFALMGLGRDAEALAAFECALEHIPGDSQTWSNKGMCLYRLGRFDEALAVYDEAVRVNPDDVDLRKSYAWAASNIRRTTIDQRMQLRDGRWLGYLDYGDPAGTPIFCFHGTPNSRLAHFADDNLLKELHIRLIVPDRPGYGLSDFQPRRHLLDWPADVEQLADHLGIQRFAVLGRSGGGPHAAACAYSIPQRLTRVGIVSGGPPQELAPLSAFLPLQRIANFTGRYFPRPLLRAGCYPSLRSARSNPGRWARVASIQATARAGESFKSLFARIRSSVSSSLAPTAREQILEPFRQGVRDYAEDVWVCHHPWGFRPDDIHGIEVYLWHGELDSIVPVSVARALAAAIPGCHATFYPDESHDAYTMHTREILTALTSGAAGEHNGHEAVELPKM